MATLANETNLMDWLDILKSEAATQERGEPLYAQIMRRLRDSIESGQLPPQTKLPTNRELANLLKVDRSTVSRAYLELSQAGLIESHVGRGTFVSSISPKSNSLARHAQREGASINWAEKYSQASHTSYELLSKQPPFTSGRTDTISFAGGIPTEEFYPHEQFERIVRELMNNGKSAEMFNYSPAEGHPLLMRQVQKHLSQQGIEASDDEMLIVNGSQQAIDLVTNTLVDAGDAVILEEPSYFWAICNFRSRQANCLTLSLDAQGIIPRALEKVLDQGKVKLLYTMPTFQNPTGCTQSVQRRLELLDLCRRYQVPILEDNFVGDLRYDGEPLPPLRALPGGREIVIHQGTFSKALCPGLRLGWLVGPQELIKRVRLAKRTCDLSTNSMAQIVLAQYLEEGLYAAHLDRVRQAYRKRRDTMTGALERYAGSGQFLGNLKLSWTIPAGGLFLWASLPAGCSSRELLQFAEREGVTFALGELNFCNGEHPEFMRLCFIQQNEEVIEEGVKRLARALSNYFESISMRPKTLGDASRSRRPENVLI
jgi:2-aminoadipate transaminase